MTRIAVIGNAGGGKSTLCRRLSTALELPFYAMDNLQWRPNWVAAPLAEIKARHDEILAQEKWIVDGWGDWELIQARFEVADTIILINHSLWVHYWWAAKRQFMCLFRPRPDGPESCPMLPMTWRLIKMIWTIHHRSLPQLKTLIDSFRDQKHVIDIHSPQELKRFIRQYC